MTTITASTTIATTPEIATATTATAQPQPQQRPQGQGQRQQQTQQQGQQFCCIWLIRSILQIGRFWCIGVRKKLKNCWKPWCSHYTAICGTELQNKIERGTFQETFMQLYWGRKGQKRLFCFTVAAVKPTPFLAPLKCTSQSHKCTKLATSPKLSY